MGKPGPPLTAAWATLLRSPGGEGTLGVVSGQFLAPQTDRMGKIGEGGVTASKKKDFSPNVFPRVLGIKNKRLVYFPKAPIPRAGNCARAPLHALTCCCCHHTLETHPQGSGKIVSW